MPEENNSLLTKLVEMENRHDELEKQISDPAIATDSAKVIAISKEKGKLKTIVAKYREYKKASAGLEDARRIVEDASTDEDFRAMAKEEAKKLEEQKNRLLAEMQNTLVMAEDDSIDSVIMEIRAGTGGDEAALFARDLYNMYLKYAEARRWKIEQLDFSVTDGGGFREVIFGIKGRVCGRSLDTKAADIASSVCRKPKRRAESIHRLQRWRCCRSRRKWIYRLIPMTLWSRCVGPAGLAVRTSTRSAVPSVLNTFQPELP